MLLTLPKDELELLSKYNAAISEFGAARNIPYSQKMALYRRMKSGQEPPLCACGCGGKVNGNPTRKIWSWYILKHQPKPGMSDAGKERVRANMIANNPMKRAEIAAKVSASQKGITKPRSESWRENVSAAAKKRMTERNPMWDKSSFQASMKGRDNENESIVAAWIEAEGLPIVHVGNGDHFIEKIARCPDFKVLNHKRVLEIGTAKSRSSRYCKQRILEFDLANYETLVILSDDFHRDRAEIMSLIRRFAERGGSGCWKNGSWIPFNAKTKTFKFSTFLAARQNRT